MTRRSRYPTPSAKDSRLTPGETRQHFPEPTGRCAVELRLPIALQDRLLAIAEAGVLGRTVDEVVSHFLREKLHRDWLALEVERERVPTFAAPPPAQPALVRSGEPSPAFTRRGEKRLIRMPDVCKRIGVSRSSLYKMIHLKTFPPPKRLSGRSVAWLESDIETWVDSRTTEGKT